MQHPIFLRVNTYKKSRSRESNPSPASKMDVSRVHLLCRTLPPNRVISSIATHPLWRCRRNYTAGSRFWIEVPSIPGVAIVSGFVVTLTAVTTRGVSSITFIPLFSPIAPAARAACGRLDCGTQAPYHISSANPLYSGHQSQAKT